METLDFFGDNSAVNVEIDFDMGDFDFSSDDDGQGAESLFPGDTRIWKPKLQKKTLIRPLAYRNAREFVRDVDLTPGARTFAWVDGSFIFGDVIEALCEERDVRPKKVYISTLSASEANINSLRIVEDIYQAEEINLILSAYFYSHEKYGIVPYLYRVLDVDNKLQVAFANVHTKLIAIESKDGDFFVLHGSANLRSSNSIEHVMVENDRDLYEFNRTIFDEILRKQKTVNKDYLGGKETWQAVVAATDEVAKAAAESAEPEKGESTK